MTKHTSVLNGLYVITDRELFLSRDMDIVDIVGEAIRGGARIVQYRDKQSEPSRRLEEAKLLQQLCHAHHVTFLINDDVELALEVGADGVHLGQSDTPLIEARKLLGPDRIIGVTCHNRIELAEQAQLNGADYVAFGRFFPSHTKPTAPPATPEILEQARATLTIPIVAIGGITPANAPLLLEKGATMLAVSHAVFAADNVRLAATAFSRLFDQE